jgi:hypothetical protein
MMRAATGSGSSSSAAGIVPEILLVPPDQLGTSFAKLRSPAASSQRRTGPALCEMPLRVVRADDGRLEVIDGFKRLCRWRAAGAVAVPVVIEGRCSPAEAKQMLLASNAPPRSVSAMDEARVLQSMRTEDGLSVAAIAGTCNRKRGWVDRRLMLARSLSPALQARVDLGTVGPSLAHAMCAVPNDQQDAIADSIERHRLMGVEGLALVSAWRHGESERERRHLLEHPLDMVRPAQRSVSPLSATGAALLERIERIRRVLTELVSFRLPVDALTPAEERRLRAEWRRTLHQLFETARVLAIDHAGRLDNDKEEIDGRARSNRRHGAVGLGRAPLEGDQRATGRDHAAAQGALRHAPNRELHGTGAPNGAGSAASSGPAAAAGNTGEPACSSATQQEQQARCVSCEGQGEGGAGAADHPHPARDPQRWLHGWTHDPRRPRAVARGEPSAGVEGAPPLRDRSR